MVYEVVQEYIEPLSNVLAGAGSEPTTYSRRNSRVQPDTRPFFVWGFFLNVIQATALFLVVTVVSVAIDKGAYYLLTGNAFRAGNTHGLQFALTVTSVVLLGANLMFFILSLTRSLVRLLYRA